MNTVCILLDNQSSISHDYRLNNYDWDSFIWGFEQNELDCYLVGEHAINDYKDLLQYEAVLLEGYPTLTKFMLPLIKLKERPLVVVLEARSNHIACFLDNESRMQYFSWIKQADYTSVWCYHGLLFYKPQYQIELIRPVPPEFRDLLSTNHSKEKYIVSPIYMRGTIDYNIQILYELGQLLDYDVKYSIQFEDDYEYWQNYVDAYYLLNLQDQCNLYGNAFCGIKFWPTNADIGGRISYMMAKLKTPYISTPAMIHRILWPELCINPYEGLEGIMQLIRKLEDNNFYDKVVNYALSKCSIIERGGRDWDFLVNKIKEK